MTSGVLQEAPDLTAAARQGIKDTLHLFNSVILGRNAALLFSVTGLKSLDISVFSLQRCMMFL